jgi:RNA polymerase sigma-54 factor
MKLGQQLRIKQNQSLVMTPQLQQAIKLLQLSNIELAEYIENAKLENPFLNDKVHSIKGNEVNSSDKNTPDICDNLNNTTDPLKNESITELQNTFDSHVSSDFNAENKGLFERDIVSRGNPISAGEVIEKTAENKISLREFLINQINIDFKDKNEKAIAIAMIDYLHPSGWMITPLSEIAEDLSINENIISSLLKKLKKLEPTGIFSINLSECLKYQLIESNKFNNAFKILLDNLESLPSGKFKQISKLCSISEQKLFEMLKLIKTLNPKPAENFNIKDVLIDQPDVIISKTQKGWRIDLNGSTLPTVDLDVYL